MKQNPCRSSMKKTQIAVMLTFNILAQFALLMNAIFNSLMHALGVFNFVEHCEYF